MFSTSGAPSAHSLVTSFGLHGLALIVLLLVPAGALVRIAPPEKEVNVVFHRPAPIESPVPPPSKRGAAAGPARAGARSAAHPPPTRRSSDRSTAGAPSAHSLVTSFGLHGLALIVLLLVPAGALVRIAPPDNEVNVVFHRPAPVERPPPPASKRGAAAGPARAGE